MSSKAKDRYESDPDDGLRRDIVGDWAEEKHARLRRYVDITHATRRKFSRNSPAYIDLYCATGRARIRETARVVDGSPLVASLEAKKNVPFGQVHIGDLDTQNLAACKERLGVAGVAGVKVYEGKAEQTAADVVRSLNPYGLHLAFLDPYSLDALPFAVVKTLAGVKRMDFIIHINEMDFQRNVIGKREEHKLDTFAPGWRDAIDTNQRSDIMKQSFLSHYKQLLTQLGYYVSDNIERVTGSHNQPLYWLLLASRDKLADKFWSQISNVDPQARMFQ
ncbi:three-Cys-motif partner protein TcmP [Arenimonas sp.]|uniref:three-Cys-motif partner protein TcmP n=1 Tax=Arenimonas sp. TaxID=1872635 RepID=UPI0039E55041